MALIRGDMKHTLHPLKKLEGSSLSSSGIRRGRGDGDQVAVKPPVRSQLDPL